MNFKKTTKKEMEYFSLQFNGEFFNWQIDKNERKNLHQLNNKKNFNFDFVLELEGMKTILTLLKKKKEINECQKIYYNKEEKENYFLLTDYLSTDLGMLKIKNPLLEIYDLEENYQMMLTSEVKEKIIFCFEETVKTNSRMQLDKKRQAKKEKKQREQMAASYYHVLSNF